MFDLLVAKKICRSKKPHRGSHHRLRGFKDSVPKGFNFQKANITKKLQKTENKYRILPIYIDSFDIHLTFRCRICCQFNEGRNLLQSNEESSGQSFDWCQSQVKKTFGPVKFRPLEYSKNIYNKLLKRPRYKNVIVESF